jgi:hypothetical protein
LESDAADRFETHDSLAKRLRYAERFALGPNVHQAFEVIKFTVCALVRVERLNAWFSSDFRIDTRDIPLLLAAASTHTPGLEGLVGNYQSTD